MYWAQCSGIVSWILLESHTKYLLAYDGKLRDDSVGSHVAPIHWCRQFLFLAQKWNSSKSVFAHMAPVWLFLRKSTCRSAVASEELWQKTPEALAHFLKAAAGMQHFGFLFLCPHEKWELFPEKLGLWFFYLILKHCGQAGSLQKFVRLWDLRLVALVVMMTANLRILVTTSYSDAVGFLAGMPNLHWSWKCKIFGNFENTEDAFLVWMLQSQKC